MRLKDVDAIMEALNIFKDKVNGNAHFLNGIKTAKEIIDNAPTIEAEPVRRGQWVWLSSTSDRRPCEMRFWCSECHHETIVHTYGLNEPWENFCPNCGAIMDSEVE